MIPLFMMFAGGPLGSGKQWYVPQLSLPIECYARHFHTWLSMPFWDHFIFSIFPTADQNCSKFYCSHA